MSVLSSGEKYIYSKANNFYTCMFISMLCYCIFQHKKMYEKLINYYILLKMCQLHTNFWPCDFLPEDNI